MVPSTHTTHQLHTPIQISLAHKVPACAQAHQVLLLQQHWRASACVCVCVGIVGKDRSGYCERSMLRISSSQWLRRSVSCTDCASASEPPLPGLSPEGRGMLPWQHATACCLTDVLCCLPYARTTQFNRWRRLQPYGYRRVAHVVCCAHRYIRDDSGRGEHRRRLVLIARSCRSGPAKRGRLGPTGTEACNMRRAPCCMFQEQWAACGIAQHPRCSTQPTTFWS